MNPNSDLWRDECESAPGHPPCDRRGARVTSILSRQRGPAKHLAEPDITTQALEGIARLFGVGVSTGKHVR